jgi:catechol 2,3-dioxygenase-like lactoylglutathione lyase family enzyme
MRVQFVSILVADQAAALEFYTTVLGFVKKSDVPLGEYRWLTVVSPEDPDGVEISIEPVAMPFSRNYQKACHDADIPLLALVTKDVRADVDRLKKKGVVFRGEPEAAGTVTTVRFEDTCGNLVILIQLEA